MKKKQRKQLERIEEVMKGKRDMKTLSLKELIMMNELMYEAVERMYADRMMPPSGEIH